MSPGQRADRHSSSDCALRVVTSYANILNYNNAFTIDVGSPRKKGELVVRLMDVRTDLNNRSGRDSPKFEDVLRDVNA